MAAARSRRCVDMRRARPESAPWVRVHVAVLALVGAWLGHFFEYLRVSGVRAGFESTTTSVHGYFLPAGLAVLAVIGVVGTLVGRVWVHLGHRLAAAEAARWHAPRAVLLGNGNRARADSTGPVRAVARLWLKLTLVQILIWVVQENMEAAASGHRPPLFGVLAGAHLLAPFVQAEVALLLSSVYCLIRRRIADRRDLVGTVEAFLARRWQRATARTWSVRPAVATAFTPLDLWGAQLWTRPPPEGEPLLTFSA